MNKVLIVGRYHGTRIPGLLKYLPEFGWQPILLTTTLSADLHLPGDISVTEVPYRETAVFWKKVLFKDYWAQSGSGMDGYFIPASGRSLYSRILSRCAETINYPDDYKGWKKSAISAGDELLKTEKIDVILSSSSPVTSHLIARELKRKHHIPWIADLRDLWSQNHNYYYSSLRRMFDKRLELKTLAQADTLVTVSQLWANRLATLHKGKSVAAITNGFDPEMLEKAPAELNPGFTITYTGNIYRGKQNPRKFFAALRNLISEGEIDPSGIEIRFYGPKLDWLEKEITEYTLSGIVKQYGMVSPPVAIEKQKESQLLLLLDWDDPGEKGVCPLKFFEYLGAERPVLAIGGVEGNAIDLLLGKTKAGMHAITEDNIKESLRHLYQEYKLKGQVAYYGLGEEISQYTHQRMAGEFADILNRFSG